MERIVLSNNKTLDIYAISNVGEALEISFRDADMTMLEETFSNQAALEKIQVQDADGNIMSVFKNYGIFVEISKKKNVVMDEISEETSDIITVTLAKEQDWQVALRKAQEMYDGAIMDLGVAVSAVAEGSEA